MTEIVPSIETGGCFPAERLRLNASKQQPQGDRRRGCEMISMRMADETLEISRTLRYTFISRYSLAALPSHAYQKYVL